MIKFYEKHNNEFKDLSEMANYRKNKTGLPVIIYISDKQNVKGKHGPRIKVSKTYGENMSTKGLFTVTISDNPEVIGNTGDIKKKDIKKIKTFILLNKKVLLEYWDFRIGADILSDKLKSI